MKGTRAPTAVLDFAPRAGLTGLTPLLLLDWTLLQRRDSRDSPLLRPMLPRRRPTNHAPAADCVGRGLPGLHGGALRAPRPQRRRRWAGRGSERGGQRGSCHVANFALAFRARPAPPKAAPLLVSCLGCSAAARTTSRPPRRRAGEKSRGERRVSLMGVPIGPLEEASDSAGLELSLFCAARRPRLSRPPPPTQTSLLRRSRRVVVCGAAQGAHNSNCAEIVLQMDDFGCLAPRHIDKKLSLGFDPAARILRAAKGDRARRLVVRQSASSVLQ